MNTIRRVIPFVLIVAAPAAMMYPLWTDPTSAGEDDLIYYYPLRKMVGQSLRAGRLPLHDPLEATGMPLMADPQASVLFPPTWLFAAVEARLAYSITIFLTFSFAGAGAYLYLRRLVLIRPAAAFGAAAFMFSGFMVGHRVHLAMIQTAAFLPWGMLGIEMLRTRPGRAFALLVPVGFGAMAAGHWPILTYMALAWLGYFVVRARPLGRSLAIAGAAAVVAGAIAAPQLVGTAEIFAQATRRHIGYAIAGENSFFPLAGALAVFPFLMGSRTPNFYPQQWWGPWHLCEMLGYVGLVTLVLAAAAAWRLYRRKNRPLPPEGERLRGLVRVWTWLAVGAGVWMFGYYLPTYRLIYQIPGLGVIRCPARMILVVDLALAVLAAISIHALAAPGAGAAVRERLGRLVRLGAGVGLPILMLVTLGLFAAAAALTMGDWADRIPLFAGGARDVLAAVGLHNPAVWVPLILMLASFAVVRFWLHAPGVRAPALVALLLVDLLFVARFVDVPRGDNPGADPERSPAVAWLAVNADGEAGRVWGLARTYHDRANELLLPKLGSAHGVATFASYGAWQSPAQAHLLGFSNYGQNHNWAWLLRRNHLLTLYGVRYVLAAERQYCDVIESVRVPAAPAVPDGPNLLGGTWRLRSAELADGVVRLRARYLSDLASAAQPVRLEPGTIYHIALDARGPDDGAGYWFGAGVFGAGVRRPDLAADGPALRAVPARIGPDWRHFEQTFRAPEDLAGERMFWLYTASERPIEVRNVSLAVSHWPAPVVGASSSLRGGDRVYRKVAELPALRASERPVVVYENRLWRSWREAGTRSGCTPAEIEKLKWTPERLGPERLAAPPTVGMHSRVDPRSYLLASSLPGVAVYTIVVGALAVAAARRKKAAGKSEQTSHGTCP